jgi:hypothetical protein
MEQEGTICQFRWGDLWQCRRCYGNQNKRPGETGGLLRAWRKALNGVVVDLESYEQGGRLWMDKKNALKRAKRRALKESMRRYVAPTQAPKRFAECGSTTTSKGADNWYRLEVPIGPIGYLDNNCYRKRRRRLKAEAPTNII